MPLLFQVYIGLNAFMGYHSALSIFRYVTGPSRYYLWLAAAGTSLSLKTSLETASTGSLHINPSEN